MTSGRTDSPHPPPPSNPPFTPITSPDLTGRTLWSFHLTWLKNIRVDSTELWYYWPRRLMQLTAHYLSHSLLASILIGEEREREVNDTGQRERWSDGADSPVSITTKVRAARETETEGRQRARNDVTWHKAFREGHCLDRRRSSDWKD